MIRLDYETREHISETLELALMAKVFKQKVDAIILSDYGKGVLPPSLISKIIKEANSRGIKVYADPKHVWEAYNGAFAMTPNVKEGRKSLKTVHRDPLKMSKDLSKWLDTIAVITAGSEGAFALGKQFKAPEVLVADVQGAGDSFIAAFAFWRTAFDTASAIQLAVLTATIAVANPGTHRVTAEEFLRFAGKWLTE